MDFSLNSSLVLAVAVGLWLLWVAPYLLGGTRSAPFPGSAEEAPAPAVFHRSADAGRTARPTTPPSPPRPSQGNSMNHSTDRHRTPATTSSAAGASNTAPASGAAPAAGTVRPLRIRYGRLALALAGLAALVAVPVTLVLVLAGVGPWWLPAAAAGALAADVVALRTLAVRDRRRRVNRAFAAAMSTRPEQAPVAVSTAVEEQLPAPAPPNAPEEPFDGEKGREVPQPRLSAEELRAAALAEAVRSGNVAARPASAEWQPVELPKPTYVDAPKAERPAPAPLVLPDVPRPAARPGIRPDAPEPAAPAQPVQQAQPATGILNLDDVLQRRRA